MSYTRADLNEWMKNMTPAQRADVERQLDDGPKQPRTPAPRERSILERRFIDVWTLAKGPSLIEERPFHPTRKWRFDFVHEPSRTAIEIEGGLYQNGHHQQKTGYESDIEKYNEAILLGWTVFRLSSKMICAAWVTRIIQFCKTKKPSRRKQLEPATGGQR